MTKDTLTIIAIKDISSNPYQPRLHFNQKELEELALSIEQNGIIQPIIVRPSDIFGYELVAGERRLRAAKLANLTEIPAIIKRLDNTQSMQQAIIENLQRSDLDPIEEALAYQQLISKKELTHEELAQFMGKSRPYITNSLRLLQLPKIIQSGLRNGNINTGQARLLLTVKGEHSQIEWYQKVLKQQLTVRQLEKRLKKKVLVPKEKKDIFTKHQEHTLAEKLGLEVKIHSQKDGSGTLSITYNNLDDLNRVINSFK
ncbi:ParB/RepB/Spo0J family partition protein [Streptococcus sciuri]|uniref:ParB/RepB/Spo0J family partition protein n=1 Tax=Streptococcus sciuri TaxID=2973939 RepID=A0ABT2F671_9STRE|nr:ParB/RepB/Spo0J family partition protein [Streptococcus sciuri]MCS4487973.1 ParB/RepB/Spo0J family partition protein [Streptococcus sciuri]